MEVMGSHRPLITADESLVRTNAYPPKGSLVNSGGDLNWGAASIFESVISSNQSSRLERELNEAQAQIRQLRAQQTESLQEVERDLEQRWAGCLSDANKRVAMLEARSERDEPLCSPSPAPTVSDCTAGSNEQAQAAQLRAQVSSLELEKQELADSLNSQLVDTQRQLHQLHARRHELDEKLRLSNKRRGQVSVDLDAVNRQLVDSRGMMADAVDSLKQLLLGQQQLQELPGVEELLASVCNDLELCRQQLTDQELNIQRLQQKHETGSSSEGSPKCLAGSGKSQVGRSLTRGSLDGSRLNARWLDDFSAIAHDDAAGNSPPTHLKEERVSSLPVQQKRQRHQQQQQQQQQMMGGPPANFTEPQEQCTCAIM